MKSLHFRSWLVLLLLSLMILPQAFAFPESTQSLDLVTGKKITVDFKSHPSKYTVIIFLSIYCPCSRSHQPVLKKLYEEFSGSLFQFIGVHSNANETVEDSLEFFKFADLPFPVIQDEDGKWAQELEAYKTPHAYILSPDMKVIYQGGVDNRSDAKNATEHFLRDSLMKIRNGQKVGESKRRVLGCQILRSSS